MAGTLAAGNTNILGDLRVTQSSIFQQAATFTGNVLMDSADGQLLAMNKNPGGLATPIKLHNDTNTINSQVTLDFAVSPVWSWTTARIGVERVGSSAEGDLYFSTYDGSSLVKAARIGSDGSLTVGNSSLQGSFFLTDGNGQTANMKPGECDQQYRPHSPKYPWYNRHLLFRDSCQLFRQCNNPAAKL